VLYVTPPPARRAEDPDGPSARRLPAARRVILQGDRASCRPQREPTDELARQIRDGGRQGTTAARQQRGASLLLGQDRPPRQFGDESGAGPQWHRAVVPLEPARPRTLLPFVGAASPTAPGRPEARRQRRTSAPLDERAARTWARRRTVRQGRAACGGPAGRAAWARADLRLPRSCGAAAGSLAGRRRPPAARLPAGWDQLEPPRSTQADRWKYGPRAIEYFSARRSKRICFNRAIGLSAALRRVRQNTSGRASHGGPTWLRSCALRLQVRRGRRERTFGAVHPPTATSRQLAGTALARAAATGGIHLRRRACLGPRSRPVGSRWRRSPDQPPRSRSAATFWGELQGALVDPNGPPALAPRDTPRREARRSERCGRRAWTLINTRC